MGNCLPSDGSPILPFLFLYPFKVEKNHARVEFQKQYVQTYFTSLWCVYITSGYNNYHVTMQGKRVLKGKVNY